MGFLRQLLFFIAYSFSLSLSFSSSSSSATQLCSHEQAAALLQFKDSFSVVKSAPSISRESYSDIKSLSKIESWKEGTDCCAWDGITCDNVTGHLIGLDLSYRNLHGSFPSNSTIFLFKNLQSLNLAGNDFKHSKIPREISQFTSLKHVDLSNTGFSGQVPEEISHLSKLASLDLSNDEFLFDYLQLEDTSSLKFQLKFGPTTFKSLVQNLSEVRELSLRGMNMSSVDPHYIMNLSSSLTFLDLSPCDLRGKLSLNIFQFPNLRLLALGGSEHLIVNLPSSNWSSPLQFLALQNMLCLGKLPDAVGDLKSLTNLFLECHLQGPIPASIGNLSQLGMVELSLNNFSGLIPPSLINLTQLRYLSLSNNQLSGLIPFHVNKISKLESLFLHSNLLKGTIPSWIFTLPSLEYLSMNDNQLKGQINSFKQKSLKLVSLANNKLQGLIPSSITNLVNLIFLDLSSNSLSGTFELDMFSKLQSLAVLVLSDNNLSLGTNITVNGTLPKLQLLHLSSCNLSEFPNFLRESSDLQSLDLSKNRIKGHVPQWMWNVGKYTLTNLNLSHNFLMTLDQLPWRNIEFLDLQYNMLQGVVFSILPIRMIFFSLSNNHLFGEISSELCKANSLEVLDLSHNNISGMIPNCLHNLSKSLSVLNLQANRFHGNMPSMFPEECIIQDFNLHGNQIEGLLPRSLVNCSMLEVLDISNNNIKDTFPHWMESLPKLQVLVLRSNKFHGFVHDTKGNSSFPKLRVLDLSNNDFVGPLPVHYIENLKGMVNPHEDDNNSSQYMEGRFSYEYSIVVILKGFIIDLEKVLTIFTSFDLSKNKFTGEIPKVIGTLSSLKGLNLSHNNLNGYIPHSLGNLTNLEWLDLSSNELVGEIPQELVSLTSLSVLSLSNNQLVGCIPQGNQFNTFENSSYEGNTGLYGFPLTKSCDGNGMPQQPPSSIHGKDHELWEFGWRVVLLGYGCGLVFGLLVGYLAFQIGKPKWFVTLFDGQQNQRARKVKKAQVRAQRRN